MGCNLNVKIDQNLKIVTRQWLPYEIDKGKRGDYEKRGLRRSYYILAASGESSNKQSLANLLYPDNQITSVL